MSTTTDELTERSSEPSPGAPTAEGISARRTVWLVTRRELIARGLSKMSIWSTLITLVLIVAASALPALLSQDAQLRLGTVGAGSEPVAARLPGLAEATAPGLRLDVRALPDRDAAADAVRAGDLDAALIDGREILVHEELDDQAGAILEAAHRQSALVGALDEAGVAPERIGPALNPPPLAVSVLEPVDEAGRQRQLLTYFGTVLLYLQLVFAGSMIASGVVEEKASRVVELLLAKARPGWLLTGKILGMGLVAFGQLVLFVIAGLSAGRLAGTFELPPETVRAGAELLVWFIPGFALYACLFAMTGALAGRPEDLQNTSQLVGLVMLLGYAGAFAALIDADGTLARVAGLIPVSAPMVQPVRSAAGAAEPWELVAAMALILVSIVFVVRLTARVYAGGVLHFQGSLKLREALRRSGDGPGR